MEQQEVLTTTVVPQPTGKCVQLDGYTYPAVEWEGEWVAEAYLHDATCLPHQLPNYEAYFPRVEACEALPEDPEPEDWLEERGLAEIRA